MRTVDRERLFNEVVQFDAKALQNGGGSGLGLFLSAKVIEMHGGIIGVDMQRAAPGSTFFIALPIHSVGAAGEPAHCACGTLYLICITTHAHGSITVDGGESSSPPPQQFTVSSLRTTTARVLLVDDVPMCRKFHVHMLKDSVKELVEACDGEEAVERVKQSMAAGEPFDAVIMDSCMPKLSGPLAARIMRDMGFKGKIFAVTGNAFESDIEDCIAHGADHVLVKPIRAENYAFIMDCL
jgi:CheY-like chemotaxis protein